MNDLTLAVFPFSVVERLRSSHQLDYQNLWSYDYAFSDFMVVPYCLEQWANEGIRLDEKFVNHLWWLHANKKQGNHDFEKTRARKLVLDAFRAVYDMAAIGHLSGVQVLYRASDDSAGRDLRLMLDRGPTWVQLSVSVNQSADYSSVKRVRRLLRGCDDSEKEVFTLVAEPPDLDWCRQPWVPTKEWYASVPSLIENYVEPTPEIHLW